MNRPVVVAVAVLLALAGDVLAQDAAKTNASPEATAAAQKQDPSSAREQARSQSAPLLAAMAKDHGYALPPGKDLIRVARPFAPIRDDYYRIGQPIVAKSDAGRSPPAAFIFHWKDNRLQYYEMLFSFGDKGYRLDRLLDRLVGIKSQYLEGPEDPLKKQLEGDWVIREGADKEEVVRQLNAILRNDFELPVKLQFREVEQPVYVVRGDYSAMPIMPLPGQKISDRIEVFSGHRPSPDGGAGGGSGDFRAFLDGLGQWIQMPILSEVKTPPTKMLRWRYTAREALPTEPAAQFEVEDHDPELVLPNITNQTGLLFSREKRPVKLLFVERIK